MHRTHAVDMNVEREELKRTGRIFFAFCELLLFLRTFPNNHCSCYNDVSKYIRFQLETDCINLGQGYMNFAPPSWTKNAAIDALNNVACNHYSHPKGRLRLREALKKIYDLEIHRDLDVEKEILITSGANEGEFMFHFSFS